MASGDSQRGVSGMTRLAHGLILATAFISAAVSLPALGQPSDVAQPSDESCAPAAGLEFVCGPQNPEDLVLVPGTDFIIASSMTEGAGLVLVDANDATWSVLYPGSEPRAAHDPVYAGCTEPPDPARFNAHGLSLRAGSGGHSTLYAVVHGERESIEVFDVDATGERPAVTWTGCVRLPEGLEANSVASFADGSLVATVLILPGRTFADSVAMRPTGVVLEWSPGDSGFTRIEGTELPGNNGIEVSPDGEEIYVVSSGFQTVVAFSNTNPARELRTTEPLPFTPDNVHLDGSGRLLTAGMKNDVPECGGKPGPQHDLERLSTCPRGTFGIAIDPATMEYETIVDTPATPVFSNATMVLTHDGRFWLGTFRGDRIAYGDLPSRNAAARLSDREAIEQVLARANLGFELSDPDLFAGAFAEDAVYELTGEGPVFGYQKMRYAGRDDIRTIITDRLERSRNTDPATLSYDPASLRRYNRNSDSLIEIVDDDTARHTSTWMVVMKTNVDIHISAIGRYEDELVKRGGEWLILRRVRSE